MHDMVRTTLRRVRWLCRCMRRENFEATCNSGTSFAPVGSLGMASAAQPRVSPLSNLLQILFGLSDPQRRLDTNTLRKLWQGACIRT